MQLSTNNGLLVFDCDNLTQSAHALFKRPNSATRVDYRKLDTLMYRRLQQVLNVDTPAVKRLAFVSIKPQQHTQLDFLCYLGYLGYTVYPIVGILDDKNRLHKHPDYFRHLTSEIMRFYVEDSSPRPVVLLAASGSSRLRGLYYKLQSFGVAIELYGFTGSISGHIEDVERHFLDDDFLLPSS